MVGLSYWLTRFIAACSIPSKPSSKIMSAIKENTSRSRNSSMTGEAYDLLDCFVSGIDDLVYEIAESMAAGRGSVSDDGVVEISQSDVKRAADAVFTAIREQAGKSIPEDVAKQVESMHKCVLSKCQTTK